MLGLSPQAIILAVIHIAVLVIAIIYAVKTHVASNLPVPVIVFVVLTALLVYDTNCLTQGTCGVWSWVRTILYCIGPVTLILLVLISPSAKAATLVGGALQGRYPTPSGAWVATQSQAPPTAPETKSPYMNRPF